MSRRRAAGNQGIQARFVSAGVLAVGERAKATARTVRRDRRDPDLAAAVTALRQAIEELGLDAAARKTLVRDLVKLQDAARQGQPDRRGIEESLRSLAGKLKAVGVVLGETLALREPVEKIASLIGTTLSLLKLW